MRDYHGYPATAIAASEHESILRKLFGSAQELRPARRKSRAGSSKARPVKIAKRRAANKRAHKQRIRS